MPFDGECLFGESFDKFIKKFTEGKVLLPQKKKSFFSTLLSSVLANQGFVPPFFANPAHLDLTSLARSPPYTEGAPPLLGAGGCMLAFLLDLSHPGPLGLGLLF